MKRLLVIIVLGLLFSGSAHAASVWDYLKTGMTKKQFKKIVDGSGLLGEGTFYGLAAEYRKEAVEMKRLDKGVGWCCDRVFVGASKKTYFKEFQTEILTHRGGWNGPKKGFKTNTPEIYYIFENVTEPTYCLFKKYKDLGCKGTIGNGTLKTVVFSKEEALMIADPAYAKQKNKEKEKRIAEEKRKKEEAEKAKTVAKKPVPEKNIIKDIVKWTYYFQYKSKNIYSASSTYDLASAREKAFNKCYSKHNAFCKRIKYVGTNSLGKVFIALLDDKGNVTNGIKMAITSKKEPIKVIVKKPKKKEPPKKQITKAPEIDESLLTIGSGSGFYINNKGYALTNNHVVDICKQMVAVVDGREILFRVLNTDKTNDVAIIKTDQRSPNFIKINEEGAKLGEDIIAVGYPLSGRLSDSVKITRGIVSALSGIDNNSGQIQIDAALQPGNSGGPVINENGELIGIASAGLNKLLMAKEAKYIPENVNFAVSSSIVTNILKNKKVSYSTPSFFSGSFSNTELATLGDKVTLQLFCRNTRTAYNKLKRSKQYSHILIDLD